MRFESICHSWFSRQALPIGVVVAVALYGVFTYTRPQCFLESAGGVEPIAELPRLDARRKEVLSLMPQNQANRCFAIAIVTEALLEGLLLDEMSKATCEEDVAGSIIRRVAGRGPLTLPHRIITSTAMVSTYSEAALNSLISIVDREYKNLYHELLQTENGRSLLLRAEGKCLTEERELKRIIQSDADQIACFFGFGFRAFPDGRVKESGHAFLLTLDSTGAVQVYDSNQPGQAHACHVQTIDGYVTVQWECLYRDTGTQTLQRFRVTSAEEYMRTVGEFLDASVP